MALLAVGITAFEGTAVGGCPWRTSVSEGFTPGLGWGGEHTSSHRTLPEGLVLAMCRKCKGLLLMSMAISKAAVKTSSCSSSWVGITHR